MHKNEAIAQVASKAMEQIFDIAQFAISRITDGAVSDIEPMVQTSFAEVAARATAVEAFMNTPTEEIVAKSNTRKPRKPKDLEPTPTSESDFVEEVKEIEPEQDSTKIYAAPPFLAVSEDNFNVEDDNPDFPNHPDDWFSQDVERARNACRSILAKMVSKHGSGHARASISTTTSKVKATDFTAEDCMTFYRKFRNEV